jgi:hypothetical protein
MRQLLQAHEGATVMEIFSLEWRAYKVQLGDQNLQYMKDMLDKYDRLIDGKEQANFTDLQAVYLRAQLLVSLAQAHYAAANIRVSSPRDWKNES